MSTMTMTIKIAAAAFGVAAVAAFANAARAQSDAEAFDSCTPHDWQAFAAAVEGGDIAALRRMIDAPELGRCDVLATTARVLVCEADPLTCIEPAAGPEVPPVSYTRTTVIDCPIWNRNCTDPLPPPGAHIGTEHDQGEGGSGGTEGGGAPTPTPSLSRSTSIPFDNSQP